jgi:hypothetical protein
MFNKKVRVEGDIVQIDKNSSYPSTYRDFEGIPTGKPKLIEEFHPNELVCYYIVIDIKKFKCKHGKDPFPLIERCGLMYVNKTLFEFMRKNYEFEYEFITGLSFDGYNTEIKDLIMKLYLMRMDAKKKGFGVEKVIKRLMNSFYGKSIQKQKPVYREIVPNEKLSNFVYFNQDFVYSTRKINEFSHQVKLMKPIMSAWSIPQFACNVLNYSKIQMLDLVYRCNYHGCEIFYINTDCLTMKRNDLEFLKNGVISISDKMGEFSIEVESKLFIGLSAYKNLHVLSDGSSRVRYPRKLYNEIEFFEKAYLNE